MRARHRCRAAGYGRPPRRPDCLASGHPGDQCGKRGGDCGNPPEGAKPAHDTDIARPANPQTHLVATFLPEPNSLRRRIPLQERARARASH